MDPKLDEYLKLKYTVLVKEGADGSFFAEIAELPGCWAEGKNESEARDILEEAKRLWINTQLEDGQPIPEPRKEVFAVVTNLHGTPISLKSPTVLLWASETGLIENGITNPKVYDLAWTGSARNFMSNQESLAGNNP